MELMPLMRDIKAEYQHEFYNQLFRLERRKKIISNVKKLPENRQKAWFKQDELQLLTSDKLYYNLKYNSGYGQNKRFVLKRITQKFNGYSTVKYLKMSKPNNTKNKKTVYDERNVAYVVDLETGEQRRKFRSEMQQNINNSKARTLKKLREYVQANEWAFFVTLTFNNDLQDRLDDNEVIMQFRKYIDNLKHQFPSLFYVFVAEYHKKGGLHFHGVLGGITARELGLKYSHSKKIKRDSGYQRIYNITKFKYGFTTATKVENSNACGHYIMKYVTKQMGEVALLKNNYMASKNLKLPETSIVNNFIEFDFDLKNFVLNTENETLLNKLVYVSDKIICYKVIEDNT